MTDSPFAPGTHHQIYWDSTSLGALKECPRKYYYTVIAGLRPGGLEDNVHLRFGLLYHAALEQFDKLRAAGETYGDAVAETVLTVLRATWDDGKPWESGHDKKTRFTLVRSIIWYLEEFCDDAARTFILANGAPAVELSFRFGVADDLFLCGHLDRVVDFQGGRYVMDRKTTTSTPGNYYFDQYSPDTQMSLYTIAGQIICQTPMRGVILDVAQIAVGFTRFARGLTYRTPAQSEEWLSDVRWWVEQAWRFADKSYWPMNDKSCHKFSGCPYRGICGRDPAVRDEFLSSFTHRPWNPLTVR